MELELAEIILAAYALVACLMVVPICLEQDVEGRGGLERVPGVLAALLWPAAIMLVGVLVAIEASRRSQSSR